MGIFYHQFTAFGAAAQPMHAAAVQLATACAQHFAMIAAWHIGIGNSSCRAAVAVNSPFYPAIIGQPFGAMYGNSQLAIQAIALGHGGAVLGGHAERAALSAGAIPGLPPVPLYTVVPGIGNLQAVLYVDLAPCLNCQFWLNGLGGGVPNPYNGIINGLGATTNLHVSYRWPYTPAGVAAMVAFHGNPLPAQVGIIAGW